MASYNTVPETAAAEELLKKPKTTGLKTLVVGAACAAFIMGALAATATSAVVAPKTTYLP